LLDKTKRGWDMLDILGVFARMHPAAASGGQRPDIMRMLPVCNCFACENMEDRLHGCEYCKSALFRDYVVKHYASDSKSYIDEMAIFTVKRAAEEVSEMRDTVRAILETVSGPLMMFMPSMDPSIYGKWRSRDVEEYHIWVSELLFWPDDAKFKRVVEALGDLNCPDADSVAELMARARVIV
jgi:hypothetical protein